MSAPKRFLLHDAHPADPPSQGATCRRCGAQAQAATLYLSLQELDRLPCTRVQLDADGYPHPAPAG